MRVGLISLRLWSLLFLAGLLYGCGGGGSGFDLLPNPPMVGAASVTAAPDNALVTANINPNGDSTEYWVEYGTAPALGEATDPNTVGNGEQTLVVTDSLTDLSPDTVYYYRVVASSSLHTVTGSTQTFATPAIPIPVVLTAAPSSVTAGACTFNATVNPKGFATSAWFEWGTDSGYGNKTAAQSLGDGTQEIPLSQPVEQLNNQTTYHYRAVANNGGGISYGQDESCTTDVSILSGIGNSHADSDGDGISDSDEVNVYGTNPAKQDTDNDGLSDGAEINTYGTDPLKQDTDSDGLLDGEEINTYHTDAFTADSDGDTLNDGAEVKIYGTDPHKTDSDGDTLSDGGEVTLYKSDPTRADTDGDTLLDNEEVNIYKTDPAKADSDGDGIADDQEVNTFHTNPLLADSDGEGLTDGDEINLYHTDPLNQDTDGDTLDDYQEVMVYRTDPNNPDTDGDGISDGNEVRLGKDPLVPDSVALYPDLVISSLTGPLGASTGEQRSVTVTVANNGALDVTAGFDVNFYLSKDAVIDGSDIYVGKRRMINGVLTGGSDTGSATITIPSSLGEGVYYLGAIADANGEIIESDETNNTATVAATLSIARGFDGGDGSDGAVTITGTFNLTADSSDTLGNVSDGNGAQPDGFTTLLTADAAAGATSLTVASTAGFVTGDEVLVIQVIHDNNHGVYDFVKNVTVLDGTTLTFDAGLSRSYYATGNTAKGTTNTVQVMRVPHYSTLSVPDGTNLTANAFNAATRLGGILVFRADTVTVSSTGSINANALGFPGGPSAVSNNSVEGAANGFQGWSYLGQGTSLIAANVGGGGGGVTTAASHPGGGGGGYGTAGSNGEGTGGGTGGGVHGDAQLDRIYPGSGGGSGSAFVGTSGIGGRGGGVIYIGAGTAAVSGTVSANGQDGGNGSTTVSGGSAGGGGGGSGGSIYLAAASRAVTGNVTVAAGTGGAKAGDSGWNGGADGQGRIFMPDPSPPDLAVTDVTGPAAVTLGETVSILTTITNLLPADILVPFRVSIYLSPDQEITTDDVYLGERLVGGLSGNGSDTALTNVTIPLSLGDGLGTVVFNYTGGQQQFVVPEGVTSVTIQATGAKGGGGNGGKGAKATATYSVTPGDILYVRVGGQGTSSSGGYNGGGDNGEGYVTHGYGGGGASDVRLNSTSPANRIIVAAGGGGQGATAAATGGNGGAPDGADGGGSAAKSGKGATIATNGAGGAGDFGIGADGGDGDANGNGGDGGGIQNAENGGGGGSGGYRGGGGGGDNDGGTPGGGGGGSSYVGLGTSTSYTAGAGTGNGRVVITYDPWPQLYYLGVIADFENTVDELNENNNDNVIRDVDNSPQIVPLTN